METSRVWSDELVESLKWIVITFGITAVCFVVVAVLLLRHTRWGRQFWAISGDYFVGPGRALVWAHLAALLLLVVCLVRVNVLITYWSNDLYTSLQLGAQALSGGDSAALDSARDGFWSAMWLFCVLAAIHVVRALVSIYLSQAFDIRWRVWLTDRFAGDWLNGRAYYRGQFIDNTIDNPDQRIQQDITDFAVTSRQLSLGGGTAPGAVGSVLSVISFTQILWELSGPLNIFGVEVPRAMMFLVFVYVLVTTAIAFWIGYPLIQLNYLRERFTANFRYALVRLRDSAENVAFYRGERVERRGLLTRFAAVIRNAWQIVFRNLKFTAWNFGVGQASVIFPYLVQGPRFFSGAVTLGDLQQTGRAFSEIHDSLSFFRESYDDFTAYRASLIRLHGLKEASRESRGLPQIAVSDTDGGVELVDIAVRRPDGDVLIDDLSLRLATGDALVVKGPSGSGKTTLLRSLAEMWPYADGELRRPEGDDTLFLSQIPYLPLGDLRTAVCYPAKPDDVDDSAIRTTLGNVHLGHLVGRLDEEADWAKILSPGEQQRIAFARILLIRPKVAFLDEATSAVDEGLEYSLYSLIRAEVPDTILVSVSHRSTVDQHHTQQLELAGDGPWALSPVNSRV
ncbi:ABC transporter ATP-binding protein/permease [Rhodococcus sp. NPDC058514]|uniref:ABC transporter ATP-binding protein/permease n=1 Tax=unclassified Rhodococcus (in: high G+C Gram-positive bacteria) TaxID=192944 RepID=UPI003667D9EE